MRTGRRPFAGSPRAILEQKAAQPKLHLDLLPWQQRVLMGSQSRFRVVNGGRRIRKTDLLLKYLLLEILKWPKGHTAWYLAPTYRQAKMIAWRRLKDLVPRWLREGEPNETELSIPLLGGRHYELKGCDNRDSIRGGQPCCFGFDEYAYCDPFAWEEVVQPAVSRMIAIRCSLSRTPEGVGS